MFRSKLGVLVILVTVSAGLVAACTTTTGGTASPSVAGSSSATGSSSAAPEVPKVSVPLDAGKYVADTCAMVPKDVLASLGMPEAGTFQAKGDTLFTKAGPNCSWKIRGQGIGVLVSLGTGSRDAGTGGLAGLYAAHRGNTLIRFLERAPDVDGYPAVYWGPLDERPMGSCGIGVGIADDLTFDVYAQGYQGADDSCGAAGKVAAGVIKTLKGA